MRIVVAAKPDADQPWVADAVTSLVRQTGADVAVVAADEVELERLAAVPRSVFDDKARGAIERMARHLSDAGVEAETAVVPGRPVPAILDYAERFQADLIVVGSSNRPAVAARLLGSVPLDLIKRSSRPVLVITHPNHPAERSPV
ncbi:universal stress protein [Actinoplanes sp. NPDC051513]|uniref:universal stress protein n=1 Tax=Actinoplanes sp. NPDC051513 TaxID=3363908 RepID=UPI0037BAE4DD